MWVVTRESLARAALSLCCRLYGKLFSLLSFLMPLLLLLSAAASVWQALRSAEFSTTPSVASESFVQQRLLHFLSPHSRLYCSLCFTLCCHSDRLSATLVGPLYCPLCYCCLSFIHCCVTHPPYTVCCTPTSTASPILTYTLLSRASAAPLLPQHNCLHTSVPGRCPTSQLSRLTHLQLSFCFRVSVIRG